MRRACQLSFSLCNAPAPKAIRESKALRMAFLLPGFVKSIHQSFASIWLALWKELCDLSLETCIGDVRYPQRARASNGIPATIDRGRRFDIVCGVREQCPWPCSADKASGE